MNKAGSDHSYFDSGNSGLALGGAEKYINLADGPIRGSNEAIAEQGNGGYLRPKHVFGGIISWPNIAQVWKDETSVNGAGNEYSNFAVNSVRQILTLELAPQFGGLVIGQVGENTTHANGPADPVVPLAVGSGVYFGEWAPSVGSPASSGTNLNMTSADRTVWYVGDNATTATTMPSTIEAKYGVIGISMTGSDANGNTLAGGLPGNQNYYTGKLDVSYAASRPQPQNVITGTISRGGYDIDFGKAGDATTITNTGSFGNMTGTIDGQFYNAAHELAGIYTGSDTPNSVAFGGSKIANNP